MTILGQHGKIIVTWSDDSGDSVGGSAQDSYDMYNGFSHNPTQPHMALSHETQDAAIDAIRMGSVTVMRNAGIKLQTVAQCTNDQNPYIYYGNYQQRDSSWYCGDNANWRPSNPAPPSTTTTATSTTSSAPPTATCAYTYYSKAGETCTSIETTLGLPTGTIKQYASYVDCSNIWSNTPVCGAFALTSRLLTPWAALHSIR